MTETREPGPRRWWGAWAGWAAVGIFALAPASTAQTADSPVRVGVKEAPPFAIQDADGRWSGLAIDLWREVAAELELAFEFEPFGLTELLGALEAGDVEIGLGALTVTSEREAKLDFSHPFHTSGIGIAARPGSSGVTSVLARLASLEFLGALAALCGVLIVAGLAVWAFERRRNAAQFGGSTSQGVASGFWWAAVTMTTVGYGDKSPITAGGRLVALVWMFASIITISGFTAAIASTLTVSSLASEIQSADDLSRVRVAAIAETTGALALEARGIRYRAFDTVEPALAALAARNIDAVVHDRPLLIHFVQRDHPDTVEVLKWTLARQDYALALAPGNSRRESINRSLLRLLGDGSWSRIQERYLGR